MLGLTRVDCPMACQYWLSAWGQGLSLKLLNDIENRRKALANAFGADLGEAGRDYDFF